MYNSWYDVFPEIVMISDKELQKKGGRNIRGSVEDRRMAAK